MPRPLRRPKRPREDEHDSQHHDVSDDLLRVSGNSIERSDTPKISRGLRTKSGSSRRPQSRAIAQNVPGVNEVFADPVSDASDDSTIVATPSYSIGTKQSLRKKRALSRPLQTLQVQNISTRPPITRRSTARGKIGRGTDHAKLREQQVRDKTLTKCNRSHEDESRKAKGPRAHARPGRSAGARASPSELLPIVDPRSDSLSAADHVRLQSIKKHFEEVDEWNIDFESISSPFYSDEDRHTFSLT